jgi:hypothetical protein
MKEIEKKDLNRVPGGTDTIGVPVVIAPYAPAPSPLRPADTPETVPTLPEKHVEA